MEAASYNYIGVLKFSQKLWKVLLKEFIFGNVVGYRPAALLIITNKPGSLSETDKKSCNYCSRL